MIKMIEPIKELKLTIPFNTIVQQYNMGNINRKKLMSIHNNIVKTVISFLSQYVVITEYISLNSFSDNNIELKIDYRGTISSSIKKLESDLNTFMELLISVDIMDNLGYPLIDYIEMLV